MNNSKLKLGLQLAKGIILPLIVVVIAIVITSRIVFPFIAGELAAPDVRFYALKGALEITVVLFGYWSYIRFVEKRAPLELQLKPSHAFISFLIAGIVMGVPVAILYLTSFYQVLDSRTMGEMGYVFIALLAQAILGELLFRGIILRQLINHFDFRISVLVVALLLACLNILIDGPAMLVFVTLLIAEMCWCLLYLLSGSLWTSSAANFAWLYVIFSTGVLDEHWRTSAPLITQAQGPAWLTGGEFGPNASVITLVLSGFLVIWLWQRVVNNVDGKLR